MPFRSEAQRRALWAKDPQLARAWTKKYGPKPQPHPAGGSHSASKRRPKR